MKIIKFIHFYDHARLKNETSVNSSQKIFFDNRLTEENKSGYSNQKLLRHLLNDTGLSHKSGQVS